MTGTSQEQTYRKGGAHFSSPLARPQVHVAMMRHRLENAALPLI
jgi:hypothetical protein